MGRTTPSEVLLPARLLPALQRLNPKLAPAVLQLAIEELGRERSSMSMTAGNQQVYQLLKEGILVNWRDPDGVETFEHVRLVDWENQANNDFFLASQFWISGEIYKRRADLVGFVNGIPLVFIELKAVHQALKNAFDHNLHDYKNSIPQLFWYNALIILSNGSQSRIGSLSSEWEHFCEWKKINSEGEEGIISLETVLRGVCDPEHLLDIVENFTLFEESQGGLRKIIAKNHQYLGVNSAFESIRNIRQNQGRLGVFWHTQGSGKSYSMVFFSQKVLRRLPGNWTFLITTDRLELDEQIYKNFANCGIVTESEKNVRAQSGAHLQTLLQEDHRFLFTLIQKFQIDRGRRDVACNVSTAYNVSTIYPTLSKRDDIIVITDEAHRSQYDTLALNMRNALPNAAFLAFTGTPLMAGEEKTRSVFGDYVSIYNFKQSVDDGATVPLFYENRIPELQLTNPDLNQEMADLLDQAELDEAQESKLEREFSREYHLITRNDRLEKVAEDIVQHFIGRGFQGKGMVICIDKATAVIMYDKVKAYWARELAFLQAELETCGDEEEIAFLQERIVQMKRTDMAVVVSQGQNEIEELAAKGADILPHRIRMSREDLATKFKDPADPFRLVFVCAMWMTGFNAPACSTIYLDKPMRNHTLMQTIARANRVFGAKVNGLIVDYIGVFRDLQKALAIYGSGAGGAAGEGETPVKDKSALVEMLRESITDTKAFLQPHGVDLSAIQQAEGFERARLVTDAADALFASDDIKREYLNHAGNVDRLFHAILPDRSANEFSPDRKAIVIIAQKMRSEMTPPDITGFMEQVEELLDESVSPTGPGYIIHAPTGRKIMETKPDTPAHWVNLAEIDFEALRRQFEKSHKRIEAERLRGMLSRRLQEMIRQNRTRMDYHEKLQQMIEEYNSGAKNIDAFFAELLSLAQELSEEEQRAISENLNEEELAIFDMLTRPKVKLSHNERQQVHEVARQLLDTLKAERLVLDWRKNQRTRAGVQITIQEILDRLPEAYNTGLYEEKCEIVYQHVYDAYFGAGKSIYQTS